MKKINQYKFNGDDILKYNIEKKSVFLGNMFYIKNENNIIEYQISESFSVTKGKTIMIDNNGTEMAEIKIDYSNIIPKYHIYSNDVLLCSVELKPSFNKYVYLVSNGFRVEGDSRGLHYNIFDDNYNVICNITKKFFTSSWKCEVDILDPTKKVILLLISKVVALPYVFNR